MSDKLTSIINKIKENPAKLLRVVRAAQIVIGLFLVLQASQVGRNNFELIMYGKEAMGTIVEYKQEHWVDSGKSHDPFMPVVEFHTKTQIVRFQDYVGTSAATGLNSEVPVLYDANRPHIAMIKRPIMNWVPWAPMLLIGLVLLLSAFRKPKRPKYKGAQTNTPNKSI